MEYTRSGIPTGYALGLPTADTPVGTGTNYAIVGTSASTALYGSLKRSIDGRYLTITGANVPVATGTDALTFGVFSTASFPNRVIARVDAAGSVDTTTRFAARGAIPNGVITTDGTSMWWASDAGSSNSGGVRYLTLGSTVAGPQLTGIDLSPDSRANTNGIGIFDGQLYVAYNVNPFRGVYTLGTGLQQSGGPLVATTVVSSTSATDFFFANANTLYVAVSNTSSSLPGLGLQKWVRSEGGPWTNVWAANPAATLGIRGIAGSVEGESVDIFGVTLASTIAETPNSLLRVVDTLAGTSFPGFETIAMSSSNSLFRGVAFAPVPEPVAWALGLAGLGLAFAWRIIVRRSSAARSRRRLARYGILLFAALGGAVAQGQFTPGNIVVSQYGDGVTTSGNVPITLREFTTSGSATGWQVGLPAVIEGSNRPILGSISNTEIGFLKQSVDRRFLSIIGAGTAAGTTTIARIDNAGAVDSTTHFNGPSTPISVITTDGTEFWWSARPGNPVTAGTRYLTLGATTTGVGVGIAQNGSPAVNGLYPTPLLMRVIGIFNDQLYGSAMAPMAPTGTDPYSFRGVFSFSDRLPKAGPQYGTMLASSPGGSTNSGVLDGPWEFFLANESTLYIADDDSSAPASGGLQKWVLSSGSWTKVWGAKPDGAIGMRGLTGLVTGSSVQLYGITAVATSTGTNSLVALTDTLQDTIPPTFTRLATSGSNYVFRGVAFAPVPEPAAGVAGLVGLVAVVVVAARRRARRALD